MSHKERILEFLGSEQKSVCDDCLSSTLQIHPRQTVNIMCRNLENIGFLSREQKNCGICGKFKICNTSDEKKISSMHELSKPTIQSQKETTTENEIRDLLMRILYLNLGEANSWNGLGKTAHFDLKNEFNGWKCFAERSLTYALPTDDKIDHTSDILICNEKRRKYVSIEIKYRSNVTDQFKCRSYDMLHLKKTYGDKLLGIMIYVKPNTGAAISAKHAKSICYQFDHFFTVPFGSRHDPIAWNELILALQNFLE